MQTHYYCVEEDNGEVKLLFYSTNYTEFAVWTLEYPSDILKINYHTFTRYGEDDYSVNNHTYLGASKYGEPRILTLYNGIYRIIEENLWLVWEKYGY